MIAKNKFLGVAIYFVLLYVSAFKAIAQEAVHDRQPILNEAQKTYIISFIVDHQLMYGEGGLTNILRCQEHLQEDAAIYIIQYEITENWFHDKFFKHYPEYLEAGDSSVRFQDLINCSDFPYIPGQLPVECTREDQSSIEKKLLDRELSQQYALVLQISDIILYRDEYYVGVSAYRKVQEGPKVLPAGGVYRIHRFANGLMQFKEYQGHVGIFGYKGDSPIFTKKYDFEVVFTCD